MIINDRKSCYVFVFEGGKLTTGNKIMINNYSRVTSWAHWQAEPSKWLYILTSWSYWQAVYTDKLYILTTCIYWQAVYTDKLYILTSCTYFQLTSWTLKIAVHTDKLYIFPAEKLNLQNGCTYWQAVHISKLTSFTFWHLLTILSSYNLQIKTNLNLTTVRVHTTTNNWPCFSQFCQQQ